jgi:hypothetical protein
MTAKMTDFFSSYPPMHASASVVTIGFIRLNARIADICQKHSHQTNVLIAVTMAQLYFDI